MTKPINIIASVILLFLSLLIWHMSVLFINIKDMLFAEDENIVQTINPVQVNKIGFMQQDLQVTSTNQKNTGRYETIEETIARLKRDVVVTGTILGVPGEESALFQIESMPDSSFKINTQIMDGFIIKEITNTYVVLKNQVGNETFSLYIQSGEESLPELNHGFNRMADSDEDEDDMQQYLDDGTARKVHADIEASD